MNNDNGRSAPTIRSHQRAAVLVAKDLLSSGPMTEEQMNYACEALRAVI